MSAVLKIDLRAIKENILTIKTKLNKNQKFCAVVKADCYGMGARKICKEINDLVDYFAVSSEKEFLSIKKEVTKPVLLLTPIYQNITKFAKMNLEFCVSNLFQLKKFLSCAKKNKNVKFKIHLAVNTGMNRYGFSEIKDILTIIKQCQKTQNISIVGVFSHFYMGSERNISNMQLHKFREIKTVIENSFGKKDIIFHIANSDGFEIENNLNMVRIGIGMFLKYNQNSFSLYSRIVEIQHIKPNDTVGYGLGFIASKKMRVAVVGIGYADGIFRNLTTKGYVLISGKKADILAVCMDSIIVDVTNIKASLNDDVVLIGRSKDKQIFVCDIASWCDTIEYEIMTKISKRVKRVYVG